MANHYSLGIDQSLSCTALVMTDLRNYQLVDIKTIETKPAQFESIFQRVLFIADEVMKFYHENMYAETFYDIVIEGLSFGSNTNATRDLAALQAAIMFRLIDVDMEKYTRIIAPTSLKKFSTGKGNAKKIDMFEFLPPDIKSNFQQFPKTRGRFDLMDAFFLSCMANERQYDEFRDFWRYDEGIENGLQ